MKIGFIGLGSMGQPMAQNLLQAGHELTVYNDHFLTAIAHGQSNIDWAGLAQVHAENAGLHQLGMRN